MKKKVLSVLLATALFAGSAVAVNAQVWGDWDSSSKSGTDTDITALEFDAASYKIENGGSVNLIEKLTAYAGTKAVVQEPTLDWTISDNDLIFGLEAEDNNAKVFAYENTGTATVTVTANDGKVKATCKVVATPLTKATGFKFEKTSYKVPTAGNIAGTKVYVDDLDVKLVPTPNGAKFSERQITQLKSGNVAIAFQTTKAVNAVETGAATAAANQILAVATQNGDADSDGVVYKFDKTDLEAIATNVTSGKFIVVDGTVGKGTVGDIATVNKTISFCAYDNDKEDKKISRDVKAASAVAKQAERAGRTGSITLEVGQTANLEDYVKYGPSDYNTFGSISGWNIDYYNEAATDDDFAVLKTNGHDVMGIAVGKVKAVATFTQNYGSGTSTVEIPINVVAKGSVAKSEAELSTTAATVEVGQTAWVEVKNAPSDVENITWTVEDNGVATIVPNTGAGIKVFAKKVGSAKVTATYNGEEIGTFTMTVNAAGAVAPVPTPDDDTVNPPTGDSLFANLF